MLIRKTTSADLPYLDAIFDTCRAYMKAEGNLDQWDDKYPTSEVVRACLPENHDYVCISDDGEVLGTFSIGSYEAEYDRMRDGVWNCSAPYVVIHRMAVLPGRGAGQFIFNWLLKTCPHIRLDTHENNQTMKHILNKLGFKRTGIVTYEGYGDRICFDYVSPELTSGKNNKTGKLMIRPATKDDLSRMDELFAAARSYMASYGNTTQWTDNFPNSTLIVPAIESGHAFVCCDQENGEVLGVYTLSHDEPAYQKLEGGVWSSDEPYVVIHRLACVPGRGVGKFIFRNVMAQYPYIRLDTHEHNMPMLHLMQVLNFKYCGQVFYSRPGGGWRVAYDWKKA